MSKLQGHLFHWYHAYKIHTGIDRTEATIRQSLYWPDIGYDVRKEVTDFDTCQRKKR